MLISTSFLACFDIIGRNETKFYRSSLIIILYTDEKKYIGAVTILVTE